MSREIFLSPEFHGDRFADHAMPVEALSELAAYQKMIVEVAKALFRLEHPSRQRVPKGFEQQLELYVRRIEEGSAIPVVERTREENVQLPFQPSGGDVFERARDLLGDLVETAALPPGIPRECLRLFNNFGKTLREDEWIDLKAPNRATVPRYDRAKRKKIILLADSAYDDDCELTGEIVQFDVERKSFTISVNGRRLSGGFEDRHLAVIRDVAGRRGVSVRIVGTGRYDAKDELISIVEICDITLSDERETDLKTRLTELTSLEPGWLDGAGEAISTETSLRVARILEKLVESGLAKPYLYPTPEGRIQAEWSFPGTEVAIEFSGESRTADAFGAVLRNQAAREETFDLDDESSIERLSTFVESFAPGFGQ